MKYLRQFVIIVAISLIGEACRYLIPLPIPASIYGLALMFAALASGLVKVGQVRDTAIFLIEIMPVMFIPSAVGLIDRWDMIRQRLVPYLAIIIPVTVIVMAVSGRVTQAAMRLRRHK